MNKMTCRSFKLPSAFLAKSSVLLPPEYCITEEELEWSKDNIEMGEEAYGFVFREKFWSEEVAIKLYNLGKPALPYNQRMLKNVVLELKKLDHTNAVKCFGSCRASRENSSTR